MKSLYEYMNETKKVYEFKIKLAGEYDSAQDTLKKAFSSFDLDSCSEATRTPIQETLVDFPSHKNSNVTIYDIVLNYPATSIQVRDIVAETLKISHDCVVVRNIFEDQEDEINHQHDEKSGESLLNKPYEKSNNQDLVGDKHTLAFLKELGKSKTQGEPYKGANNKLFTKKAPTEKKQTSKTTTSEKGVSPVGSKQNLIVDPVKGK